MVELETYPRWAFLLFIGAPVLLAAGPLVVLLGVITVCIVLIARKVCL